MKLVFIKYNAYNSVKPYFSYELNKNSKSDFCQITDKIKEKGNKLPNHYKHFNEHWDSSCRPDPDFHPERPSTGLCRNKKSGGIQNYLKSLPKDESDQVDALVFYFYETQDKNDKIIRKIIITAVFKVKECFDTHQEAYKIFYAAQQPVKPLNIVCRDYKYNASNKFILHEIKYTKCLNNFVLKQSEIICDECNDNYYKKHDHTFIEYEWYFGKKDKKDYVASDINTITKDNFFKSMRGSNATVTSEDKKVNKSEDDSQQNGKKLFGYKYTDKGEIVKERNDFTQIQSGGIEVDLCVNLTLEDYDDAKQKLVDHILDCLANGKEITMPPK